MLGWIRIFAAAVVPAQLVAVAEGVAAPEADDENETAALVAALAAALAIALAVVIVLTALSAFYCLLVSVDGLEVVCAAVAVDLVDYGAMARRVEVVDGLYRWGLLLPRQL